MKLRPIRKLHVAVAIVAVGALALSACSSSKKSSGGSTAAAGGSSSAAPTFTGEIKIGAAVPLTAAYVNPILGCRSFP